MKPTPKFITNSLNIAYEKAINGWSKFDSAEKLASDHLTKNNNDPLLAAHSIVRLHSSTSGLSGFVTGLGGLLTLPIAIPLNITSVIFIQLRMIAAIAHLGGHDLKSDQVQKNVYSALVKNSAKDFIKQPTQIIAKNGVTQLIKKKVSSEVLTTINKKFGSRLLTKFGTTGAINLGKAVPIAGGIVGGIFDLVTTKIIGKKAIKLFILEQDIIFEIDNKKI